MRLALAEAAKAGDAVRPNPQVGAVVAADDRVLSKGHHKLFGGPHAEVNTLEALSEGVKNATLYVTLEPCTFFGKTPPCTDLIKSEQISRVVIASLDPNRQINGRGVNTLREKGLKTEVGVLENEARDLNRPFFTFHEKSRPYVILKFASTLDGFIAMPDGRSKWITNEAARRSVHQLRARCDGLLVGRKTIEVDNPDLSSHGLGNDPQLFILDGGNRLDRESKVFSRTPVVFTSEGTGEGNDSTAILGKERTKNISLILSNLYEREIQTLLVEGGGETLSSFLESGMFDEIHAYIAPKLLGKGRAFFSGRASLGTDWCLSIRSVR